MTPRFFTIFAGVVADPFAIRRCGCAAPGGQSIVSRPGMRAQTTAGRELAPPHHHHEGDPE